MYDLGFVLQSDGSGGAAAILAIGILVIILLFAASIYAVYWVYKDAKKRDNDEGLWVALMVGTFLFIGVLGPALVLVVWLLVRGDITDDDNDGWEQQPSTDSEAESETAGSMADEGGSNDERDPWEWDEDEGES